MATQTEAEFHQAIHSSVGKPSRKYTSQRRSRVSSRRNSKRLHRTLRVHSNRWSNSRINLTTKVITVNVYIDFQKNSLSTTNYTKLKILATSGIANYWGRTINLSGENYTVNVSANHRPSHSIDVDLYIEEDNEYARSHNSGIVDASFIYNKGAYRGMNSMADNDFKLVAAHEFGHSVLEYFGSSDLSWTHKGSTNKYLQNVKSSTPGYPSSGEIDLMKYYDRNKGSVGSADRYLRSVADEVDVKRLVWMSNLTFIQ